MNSTARTDSTAATGGPALKPKPAQSTAVGLLTPQERESLRQDKRRVGLLALEAFKDLKPRQA